MTKNNSSSERGSGNTNFPEEVTLPLVEDVRGPAGPVPARRPGSIRRTATIDVDWPKDRPFTIRRLRGRARDLVTPADGGEPIEVDRASMVATLDQKREILTVETDPVRPESQRLVGCRGGGHLRAALDEALPGERASGAPLYLILDDISGVSLVAGIAWERWSDGQTWEDDDGSWRDSMAGVCVGFRRGSSALDPDAHVGEDRVLPVGPMVRADDPVGWHELPEGPRVSMRRARFIDAWIDGAIHIEAGFQDSSTDPKEERVAIHEYRLRATADPESGELLSLDPDPRILPFRECPSAILTASRVVGTRLGDLRTTVLEELRRANGCTHLNDAMRSLAEVPILLDHL